MKLLITPVLVLLLSTCSVFSQNQATLEELFTDVIEKSNRYEDYKVVKIYKLNNLKKNVTDSILALESNIAANAQTISGQQTRIDSLNRTLTQVREQLNTSKSKEDGIELFGMLINKSTYKTTMWSLIGLLILGCVFLVYKFKNSNAITKTSNLKLSETEEEFEQHRQRSLEREQQLRRKLQDEINKNKKIS